MIGLNTLDGSIVYYSAEKLGRIEGDHCIFVDKNGTPKENGELRNFKMLEKMAEYNIDRPRFEQLFKGYLDFEIDERIATEANIKGSTYKRFYY